MLIDLGNRQGCCPGAFPLQFVSAIGTNTRIFCRWRQLARSTVKSQLRSAETLFLETIRVNYTVTSDIHAPIGKNKYSFCFISLSYSYSPRWKSRPRPQASPEFRIHHSNSLCLNPAKSWKIQTMFQKCPVGYQVRISTNYSMKYRWNALDWRKENKTHLWTCAASIVLGRWCFFSTVGSFLGWLTTISRFNVNLTNWRKW